MSLDELFKGRKRVMRRFAIDEISAVTRPAQAGARALILKRADHPAPEADDFAKKFTITSATNGHAHLLDVNDMARLHGGGYTDFSGADGSRHNHPFTVSPDGRIVIGEAEGHVHTMETAGDPASTQKGPAMLLTQENYMKSMIAKSDVEAELEKLANERVAKSGHSESYEQAYARVLETPQGAELYRQYLAAAR